MTNIGIEISNQIGNEENNINGVFFELASEELNKIYTFFQGMYLFRISYVWELVGKWKAGQCEDKLWSDLLIKFWDLEFTRI